MNAYLFAIRLMIALFLGALVGAERQWRQRTAGLRTNCLVAMGAAMVVMVGGTVMGAVFVGILLNGLTMLNAPYYAQDFVKDKAPDVAEFISKNVRKPAAAATARKPAARKSPTTRSTTPKS